MRTLLALLAHEARLLFTWALPLTAAGSTLILILVIQTESPEMLPLFKTDPELALAMADRWVVRVVELAAPIVGVFTMSHAASLDVDAGTAELVGSMPRWAPGVILRRAAAGFLMLALSVVFMVLAARLVTGLEFSLDRPFLALPPAAFLAGVGLVVSAWTRSHATGLAAALGLWAMDVIRPGMCTGPLYLFQGGRPACCQAAGLDLCLNRLLLCAGAAFLVALSSWLYSRRGL
ncbi:MAG TPA: hypothetical protein DGR79_04665 [Clostridiales bacterium]|nr:hypothetical protein [Clostridiales bacterium]